MPSRNKLRRKRIQRNREERQLTTRVVDPLGHVDRKGRPINLWRWSKLWSNWSYRCLASTTVGNFTVITIWTGMVFDGLFETGIKRQGEIRPVENYRTEQEALEGHMRYVREMASIVPAQTVEKGVELRDPAR